MNHEIIIQNPFDKPSNERPFAFVHDLWRYDGKIIITEYNDTERNIAQPASASKLQANTKATFFLEINFETQGNTYFKLEIEDADQDVIFSFISKWNSKATTRKICNLTELRLTHPKLLVGATDLAVSLQLGALDDMKKPKRKLPADVTPMESLKTMLDKGVLTDVVIKTEERDFECHKVVLASSSEVFRAMFESGMKEQSEKEVDFTGVYDASTIEALLHYIYTRQTPPNIGKGAMSLMLAADYFQLAVLKDLCVVLMCEFIDVDMAADILLLAEKHDLPVLKKKTVAFIVNNCDMVMATAGWANIPDKMAKALLATVLRTVKGRLLMWPVAPVPQSTNLGAANSFGSSGNITPSFAFVNAITLKQK